MKPIQIAGGGLAGLTLGIGLRSQNVSVVVWEAGQYPRHRVCGEFISGRGQDVLSRMGLLSSLLDAKARLAYTTAFFTETDASPPRPLPQPAICIERYVLDHYLAKKFTEVGGELREGQRWTSGNYPEGVVCATGRRIRHNETGWRWFGLKAHFTNVELSADLEMHLADYGYVGLCRLSEERVNVCGLFRRRGQEYPSPRNWLECLQGSPGSVLHQRFSRAVLDENSFCAIAGLSLAPSRAKRNSDCRIGDALTMISPISGNGMSMAFESAEFAVGPISAYSRGELTWAQAQQLVARRCDAAFKRRLRWAWQLQQLLFQAGVPRVLLRVVSKSDWLWRKIFENTRSLRPPYNSPKQPLGNLQGT